MVEISQAGFECPVIIKVNKECITYTDVRDDGKATGNIVVEQGIISVSAAFAAPYNSFATLVAWDPTLVAWVVNKDTGEVRFYNNPAGGAASIFWDPLYDSVGLISHFDSGMATPAKVFHELANRDPADIKQGVMTYKINLDKMYSGRWRTDYIPEAGIVPEHPTAVAVTDRIKNPIGMTGVEALIDRLSGAAKGEEGYTDWFLIILYARDNSDSVAGIRANTLIYPCCKCTSIDVKVDADGVYAENIKFEAMSVIHAPRDFTQSYTKEWDPSQPQG